MYLSFKYEVIFLSSSRCTVLILWLDCTSPVRPRLHMLSVTPTAHVYSELHPLACGCWICWKEPQQKECSTTCGFVLARLAMKIKVHRFINTAGSQKKAARSRSITTTRSRCASAMEKKDPTKETKPVYLAKFDFWIDGTTAPRWRYHGVLWVSSEC